MQTLQLQDKKKSDKMPLSAGSINYSKISFPYFLYEVFAIAVMRVDGVFEPGQHMERWAQRLQRHPKTCTKSARYHLKTTIALAKIAWHMYKQDERYEEWLFMAYNEAMAGYHIKNLKRYIGAIPEYFGKFKSLSIAESIIHYQKDGKEFLCEPSGIMSFKRGRHPKGMICDDILRDPSVKLDISQLKKIETIFLEEIMSMPKEELHVFGTPQDPEDLFFKLSNIKEFHFEEARALKNEIRKETLWPEVWSWDKCIAHREAIGVKAFNKEFMCSPARSEEGYFEDQEIRDIINPHLHELSIYKKRKLNEYSYAGLDLGKKRHPSHLSVFGTDRKGRLVQLASIWMDQWDYTRQLELCRTAIENLGIRTLYYDDTRAEFEGFREVGDLPGEMRGIVFTQKSKQEMALEFEKRVRAKSMILLPDERQRRQILNVDNDLQSVASHEGHGDAFYSNALAVKAAGGPKANIRFI
jgi:hypothetical protein